MIASLVHLVIIVQVQRIQPQQECAREVLTAQVEVQHQHSLMPFQVTMLSKDQPCRLNVKLEHTVTLVKQLHANHAIQANIVQISE
jgi:hypothetical protein